MTTDTDDIKTIVKRVTDYGPKPRSVKQALIQAHAFLAEEGQWIKGEFFRDGDPQEAYEKAECSSWSACAMGALGLVTGEMPVRVAKERYVPANVANGWREAVYNRETTLSLDEWVDGQDFDEYSFLVNEEFTLTHTPLSAKAALALAEQTPNYDPDPDYDEEPWYIAENAIEAVIAFNDNIAKKGRTDVLALFEKAIRAAGGEPLPLPKAKAKASKPKAKKAK